MTDVLAEPAFEPFCGRFPLETGLSAINYISPYLLKPLRTEEEARREIEERREK